MTKILLVEDNEINRDMLRRRLERKGYQVIVAVNGAEGVTKTQTEQPDLVLMDLHLPIVDGWEATRQIKANPQTQKIPVIALTADAIAGEREKAIAAGCDEYDTKPVDFARLVEKMSLLLKPSPASESIAPTPERSLPSIAWAQVRRDLEPPIYNMLGFSDLLLNTVAHSEDKALSDDLQKIYVSALQLLKFVQAILNPALLEVQQQDWTIDLFAPALRRELLTPLSTIIGYCELLLEEASDDFMPDLEQIHNSAQELLSFVNNLDRLLSRHTSDRNEKHLGWQPTTIEIDTSLNQNHCILVIGANHAIVRSLDRQGYQVEVATTTQQALEISPAVTWDLILLEMHHTELLEQIRAKWQQIPIVLIVASDQIAQTLQGIALGATDYLIKPVPSALLGAKVATCLEVAQLREQVNDYETIVEELNEQKQIEANLKQQLEMMQIELEQIKRSHQVSEIVQTDYFQQLQSSAEASESLASTSPLKVLLVEDNELNRDMLCRRLQRQGYEVVIAHDGAEGVSKALSEQPQVILMDISLPVMDGWEATQQLKANPQTCQIPIIALTAHAMAGDREKALASGCDDYDTKPIELPRLLGKIEDCLKSSLSH